MNAWPRRWDHLALDVVGTVCLMMGVYRMVQGTQSPLNYYDEGILLSHTRTLVWGGWPFRDFYTQYPPGIYFLLDGLWRLFGTQVLVARILSQLLRLGISVLSGVAGGRLVGRRFAVLPSGLVMLWLALLEGTPFAWLCGLLCALATALALARAQATADRGPWLLTGAMMGLTLSFRHDLLLYLGCGLLLPAVTWFRRLRPIRGQAIRLLGWLAAGAIPPLLIFWLPTLIAVKWSLLYHDLYADQVRYSMPARRWPLPPLADPLSTTFAIIFAGPLLGVLAIAGALRRRSVDGPAAVLLLVLALAVVPQALGRADWGHAFYAVTPGMVLLGALPYAVGSRAPDPPPSAQWRGALAGALVLLFCARAMWGRYPPVGPLFEPVAEGQLDGSPFTRGIPDFIPEPRRQLRELVAARLRPGEPIFAGNRSHATLVVNEVDLYFILDHPSATRYLQFDPGIVTRAPVQREMVGDLESKHTRLVILSNLHGHTEPFNESSTVGSTILDDYLRRNFRLLREVGPYQVLFRE